MKEVGIISRVGTGLKENRVRWKIRICSSLAAEEVRADFQAKQEHPQEKQKLHKGERDGDTSAGVGWPEFLKEMQNVQGNLSLR